MAKARTFRIVEGGPSRDVLRVMAETQRQLRRGDVRAIAFVLVKPGGQVATVFAGHRDGYFHQVNSGISILRQRFDGEAE